MPAISVFQALKHKVKQDNTRLPLQQRAMFWFKDYSTELTKWQQSTETRNPDYAKLRKWKYTKQAVGHREMELGKLYFFMYDAKLKETLPYWDKLPLCIPIDYYDDGFLGLNLHYLSYGDRARLFDNLYALSVYKKDDFKARMKVTYTILKATAKYKQFKPCVKRYLYSHIRSAGALHIGVSEWDMALFLPCEMFQKESASFVWAESRKKFNK